MRPTESEIEFANRLYMTLTTLESLIESINKWYSEKDLIARFYVTLTKSSLAISTIHSIKSDLSFMGRTIESYVDYNQQSLIESLKHIEDTSLGSYKNDDKRGMRTLVQCSDEIETLLLAAQTTYKLLKDLLGDFLFSLTIQRPQRDCENDTAKLKILDTRIDDTFFLLEAILSDLGDIIVMEPGKDSK